MHRRAHSGLRPRQPLLASWLCLPSMLAACNFVAHTDDYSVGSPIEDGSTGASSDSGPGASSSSEGGGSGGSTDGSTEGKDVAASDGHGASGDALDDLTESATADTAPPDGGGTPGCIVTIARGAVSTPNGYQTVIGLGGFTFPFDDRAGSTSCVAQDSMCVAGSTAVASTGDWGAAFGLSLNQAMTAGSSNIYPVPSNAVGISVGLSNYPPGTRVAIDHLGAEYCAPLTGAVATAKWSDFNTQCWNNQGAFLTGPPNDATFIHFIVPAIGVARPFDFCIISIAFALASAVDAGAPPPSTDSGTNDGAVDGM